MNNLLFQTPSPSAMTRRRLLRTGLAAGSSALIAGAPALIRSAHAQSTTSIKFVLDWKLQGVHAWYYLAQERGYFKQEKIDLVIDQGNGSAASVTSVMAGAYQAGFGDMNAVIQNAAAKPGAAPVMVYMLYNRTPFALMTRSASPIRSIKDLAGKTLGSPAGVLRCGCSRCSPRLPASTRTRSSGSTWRPTCRSKCCCKVRSTRPRCSRSPVT